MPVDARITLHIYNLAGQKIRTLVSDAHPPGTYAVRWDGADDEGRTVGSGVVVVHLVAEGFRAASKMVVLH